jgi:DNA-binding NarL/FixJ family response regulator
MDLTIPGGMGGREAIQHLKKIDPNVTAIVSSGYSNDPVMSNFREYGFAGMVLKPYRVSELSEQICKILRRGSK